MPRRRVVSSPAALALALASLPLLAACPYVPSVHIPMEEWSIASAHGHQSPEYFAVGGTQRLYLEHRGEMLPGLGTTYPIRLTGPFEIATASADDVVVKATGTEAGTIEVWDGDDVIVSDMLFARHTTALSIELQAVSAGPVGHTLLVDAELTIVAHPVADTMRLSDGSSSLQVEGVAATTRNQGGYWYAVTPHEPGVATITYRSGPLERQVTIEAVGEIDELVVLPRDPAGDLAGVPAPVCFEPRRAGDAVTGVPLEITAAGLTVLEYPAYCANLPADTPRPIHVVARFEELTATAKVGP